MDVDDIFYGVDLASDEEMQAPIDPCNTQDAENAGELGEEAAAGGKKRGKETGAQMKELALTEHKEHKLSARKIAQKYTQLGLTANGVKSILRRAKVSGAQKRQGLPSTVIFPGAVAAVSHILEEDPASSVRAAGKETGLTRTSARRVIKSHLKKKSPTKAKTQRIQSAPQKKRFSICKQWLAATQNVGSLAQGGHFGQMRSCSALALWGAVTIITASGRTTA